MVQLLYKGAQLLGAVPPLLKLRSHVRQSLLLGTQLLAEKKRARTCELGVSKSSGEFAEKSNIMPAAEDILT